MGWREAMGGNKVNTAGYRAGYVEVTCPVTREELKRLGGCRCEGGCKCGKSLLLPEKLTPKKPTPETHTVKKLFDVTEDDADFLKRRERDARACARGLVTQIAAMGGLKAAETAHKGKLRVPANSPTPYCRGAPDVLRKRTPGRRRKGTRAPFASHLHAENALMNPMVFADPAKTEVLNAITRRAARFNEELVKGHLAAELQRWGLDPNTTAQDAADPKSGEVRPRACVRMRRRVRRTDASVRRRNSSPQCTCHPCSKATANQSSRFRTRISCVPIRTSHSSSRRGQAGSGRLPGLFT